MSKYPDIRRGVKPDEPQDVRDVVEHLVKVTETSVCSPHSFYVEKKLRITIYPKLLDFARV